MNPDEPAIKICEVCSKREMAAPVGNYEFQYEGDGYELMMWIQEKIDKTWSLNKSKKMTKQLETLRDLTPRETDMYPARFSIYDRDSQAFVHFNLNQATGEIAVKYEGEKGTKGGNPWWCVSEPRTPESSVCGEGPSKITLLPTSDAHGASIVEYLQKNVLRRVGAPAAKNVPMPRNNGWTNVPQNAGARRSRKMSRRNRKRRGTRNNRR